MGRPQYGRLSTTAEEEKVTAWRMEHRVLTVNAMAYALRQFVRLHRFRVHPVKFGARLRLTACKHTLRVPKGILFNGVNPEPLNP